MTKILNIRRYKAGYEVRTELIDGEKYGGQDFEIKSAYTSDGLYLGDSKCAHRLCKKRGIKPELADPSHSVCSIGFSEKEQKWYGWSHRAIYGFDVGDVVKGYIDEYIKEHPEADKSLSPKVIARRCQGFTAKTFEDAKRMAIAFAESVS